MKYTEEEILELSYKYLTEIGYLEKMTKAKIKVELTGAAYDDEETTAARGRYKDKIMPIWVVFLELTFPIPYQTSAFLQILDSTGEPISLQTTFNSIIELAINENGEAYVK